MMKLFTNTEKAVLTLLRNKGGDLVRPNYLLDHPRVVADAVQDFLGSKDGLQNCIPQNMLKSFENDFERRSMEDMAFRDINDRYYAIDCKTHNLDTSFNMPNLISIRRLANFYRNDLNVFCVLIVEYKIVNGHIEYTNCYFKPIEAFSWKCLTIGALGWGQIQLANANVLKFNKKIDRKAWMLQLCDVIDQFYDEELGKINARKGWFDEVKEYWNK